MFDELDAYLDLVATPEQKDLCLDACRTLLWVGEERHVEPIDDELVVAGSVEGDPLTNIMQGILLPLYVRVLNEYGVLFTGEITLPIAVDMLKGLLLLDNYDNPEAILTLCQTDESHEEIFAELLVLGGRYHSDDYLQYIREVSPDLLKRIEDNASSVKVPNTSDLEPSAADVAAARRRLESFTANNAVGAAYLKERMDEGMRLGMPLHLTLIGQLDHLHQVAEQKPDDAAVCLVTLLLAATMPRAEMETVIDQFASHTFTEINQSVTFRNAALAALRATNLGD